MASPKTIVISVPSPTSNGARNGVYMHPISRSPAISMKRPLALQPTEYIKIVKEEMIDGHSDIYENESKPPRKRQKLDHLNDDQKLMRRKMKNRVAAQSARDRKKVRMDDLEGQVACLTQRVSELVSITEGLTQHNAKLESDASIVRKKISQCTCGNPTTKSNITSPNITPVSINIKSNKICSTRFVPSNVENRIVATIKAPVSSATERSAVPPQPRAVALAAVVRALFVAALCSQPEKEQQSVESIKELSNLTAIERQSLVANVKMLMSKVRPSGSQSGTLGTWEGHHQPPWRNKVGFDP